LATALLVACACGTSEDEVDAGEVDTGGGDASDVSPDAPDTDGGDGGADTDATGQPCGPGNGELEACPDGYHCVWRSLHSGGCEGTYSGVCEPIPIECPEPASTDYVCSDALGCNPDTVDFRSECLARSTHFRLALAQWPCLGVPCNDGPEGDTCPPDVSCISNLDVCEEEGRYDYGTCQYPPTICDPAAPGDSRCACDGTRYDSDCHARLAGYFGTLTVCEGSGG
jgi:hypothetical protein